MTTATIARTAATSAPAGLVRSGLTATAAASVATPVVAGTASAAGVSLDVAGAPIPVLGFAVLTAIFSLVGVALAAVVRKVARSPRSTFVRTTVVLTALSLVPDAIADAAPATKALLMLTHLIAATIVIPALSRRLPA